MGSVEEDVLVVVQGGVDEQRGVGDHWAQPRCVSLVLLDEPLELDPLFAVHALEPEVLLGERDLDLLAQDLRLEDVLDADPEPHRLVGVAGADAALRRPDRQLAEAPLARLVDRHVPRHDQVGVAGEAYEAGFHAARAKVVELRDEDRRVDDAARADHALLALQDPRGDVLQLVRLAVGHDRVAGVGAAVVAADEVGVTGEQVDDLALALVTPLGPDDDGGGHGGEVCPRPDYAALRSARSSRKSCRASTSTSRQSRRSRLADGPPMRPASSFQLQFVVTIMSDRSCSR